MQQPCKNCPFRTNIKFYLPQERRKGIVETLKNDKVFTCHKLLDHDVADRTACIGSAILLQKEMGVMSNYAYRIHAMFGNLNIKKLDMDAPVFDTFEEFINCQ